MAASNQIKTSKSKTIAVYTLTIILGYTLFIIPDVFFGVTKINGGKIGINLFIIALFQFVSVTALLYSSLKILKKDLSYIGLQFVKTKKDVLLGIIFGATWTFLQFAIIIPKTGGNTRSDIQSMLEMYDGSLIGTLSFIALGLIGGGITEELFNRGFTINVLKDVFKNSKTGLRFSVILSIVLFALGHMPSSTLDWFDIMIPTIMYTLLFVTSRRLTASIVAHGIYNMLAIIFTYFIYFNKTFV